LSRFLGHQNGPNDYTGDVDKKTFSLQFLRLGTMLDT